MSKTVLITGAGSGIGLSCAEKFLENGWKVIAHYHQTVEPLKKLQQKFTPRKLDLIQVNFKKAEEIEKFLDTVKAMLLDALVNNAADNDFSLTAKDRIASVQELFLVNAVAPVLIAERVLEAMKARQGGAIVHVSSVGVKYGSGAQNIFYGMSKGALEVATRTLSREGAPYNILVNTLRPGITDTPFHEKAGKDISKRKELIPLKRVARPEEIAAAIYFLCAENTFITNDIMTVAGGE